MKKSEGSNDLKILQRKGIKIDIVESKMFLKKKEISPLHTMFDRGSISIAQFNAGTDLYEFWTIAYVGKNSCEPQERVDGSSKGLETTEGMVHAMKEFERGIEAAGHHKALVRKICIDELPLTSRDMLRSTRYKLKRDLHTALNDIAKEYGYLHNK